MTKRHFWRGMGIGIIAGTVVGMVIQPKSKDLADRANKAMRDTVDNISDSMGM